MAAATDGFEQSAHFKIPQYVWFVDEFPVTVTGKPQKFRMREIAIKKMQQGPFG